MSSNYIVTVPDPKTGDEEKIFFEPDMLDQALALFFGSIHDGAEAAELRWSA